MGGATTIGAGFGFHLCLTPHKKIKKRFANRPPKFVKCRDLSQSVDFSRLPFCHQIHLVDRATQKNTFSRLQSASRPASATLAAAEIRGNRYKPTAPTQKTFTRVNRPANASRSPGVFFPVLLFPCSRAAPYPLPFFTACRCRFFLARRFSRWRRL